jgi:hypothetical protein
MLASAIDSIRADQAVGSKPEIIAARELLYDEHKMLVKWGPTVYEIEIKVW